MTGTSKPNSSLMSCRSVDSTLDALRIGVVTRTLPLWMCVTTSTKPLAARCPRSRSIFTQRCPTLTARRNTMNVLMSGAGPLVGARAAAHDVDASSDVDPAVRVDVEQQPRRPADRSALADHERDIARAPGGQPAAEVGARRAGGRVLEDRLSLGVEEPCLDARGSGPGPHVDVRRSAG